MKLTATGLRWLQIFLFLGFLITGIFLTQSTLNRLSLRHKNQLSPEPLADRITLQKLINHQVISPPPNDSFLSEFHGLKVRPPTLASLTEGVNVLGLSNEEKHIEVDLTRQKVMAFEGNRKVYEFPTSTGKWYDTPTGTFKIWVKLKATRMSGGNPALGTWYDLANVPWVMFFANNEVAASRGFSLHGTYWHNNFGYPMSHGCINLRIEDAKTLYEWATPVVADSKIWSTWADKNNPGTEVKIYGETPKE